MEGSLRAFKRMIGGKNIQLGIFRAETMCDTAPDNVGAKPERGNTKPVFWFYIGDWIIVVRLRNA